MSEHPPEVYEAIILKELRAVQKAYDATERRMEEWNAALRRDIDTTLRAVQVNTARLADNVAELRRSQQDLEKHWESDIAVRSERQRNLDKRLLRIEIVLVVVSVSIVVAIVLSSVALWFALSNLGR